MDIELTVGMPLFKSDKIAWLPMESLCNQQGVNFKWELVACEELYHENEKEFCGKEFFESYGERLQKAGCSRIRFVCPREYIILERKWKFIIESASETSQILVLQASDNYSSSYRLRCAYDLIKNGVDWVHSAHTYFYNCETGQIILFNVRELPYKKGNNISTRIDLLKNLPNRERGHAVDSWLLEIAKSRKKDFMRAWNTDSAGGGICTDGFNRISTKRREHYDNPRAPFYPTAVKLDDRVPPYIAERLRGMMMKSE